MTLVIVETPSSASANSYVSVDTADAYLAARLNSSAWTGTEPKKQALIEATRELDLMVWKGTKATSAQALAWPRKYVPDPDQAADASSCYLDDDTIPQDVQDACCELALEFLRAGTTDIASADSGTGVIEKTVGPLTTRWQPGQRITGLARFQRVFNLIGQLLESPTGTVRLTR